jgi:hypothetical protein
MLQEHFSKHSELVEPGCELAAWRLCRVFPKWAETTFALFCRSGFSRESTFRPS